MARWSVGEGVYAFIHLCNGKGVFECYEELLGQGRTHMQSPGKRTMGILVWDMMGDGGGCMA